MGAEAKLYLSQHSIPQLFEGLMTGLIYNRPKEPLKFLETAIAQIRANPEEELSWDMFIDKEKLEIPPGLEDLSKASNEGTSRTPNKGTRSHQNDVKQTKTVSSERTKKTKQKEKKKEEKKNSSKTPGEARSHTTSMGRAQRSPSVMKAAEVAVIPHVPVILFIGGPGGGKTRHAARVANALADQGLVHICMPDVIRSALAKYKDHYSEWKTANDHYLRGELIPNHLALALVKAEMGRHPEASAFFLEGFPREARQVEDFEREVKSVNMALILDYDEKTLREHMEKRGMGMEIIDQRIKEFKQKTLPSAKYFDDQRLLHLIPGEKDDHTIFERLRDLVRKAMSTGVPILNTPSQSHSRNEVVQNDLDSIKVGASRPQSVASPQPPQSVASPQPPQSVTSPQPPYSNDTMPNGPEHTLVQPHTSTEVVNERPPTMTNHIEPPQEVHMPVAEVAAPAVAAAAVVRETTSSSRNEQNEEKPIQETLHSSQINETVVRSISPVAVNAEVAVPRSSPAHPRSESSVPNGSLTPPKTAASRTSASDNLPTGLPTNAPVLLIIGAPGAQKSDIAKRIAQKYEGFLLLSMGTLLRAKVSAESGDELWQRVARKMDQGEPVPMKLCRELLYHQLHREGKTSWGFVIEGYPRTEAQLADIQAVLGKLDLAILIDCTEQFCLDTIAKRYQDGNGGRPDDSPNVVKTRMALFKQNTLPMLKSLDEKGILRVIEGDSQLDAVFQDVSATIDQELFIREDEGGNSLEGSKNSFSTNE